MNIALSCERFLLNTKYFMSIYCVKRCIIHYGYNSCFYPSSFSYLHTLHALLEQRVRFYAQGSLVPDTFTQRQQTDLKFLPGFCFAHQNEHFTMVNFSLFSSDISHFRPTTQTLRRYLLHKHFVTTYKTSIRMI